MGDELVTAALASPAPVVSEVAADYSEILSRLDSLININFSIYAWVALFITLVVGGWCIYQIVKPLIYFLR